MNIVVNCSVNSIIVIKFLKRIFLNFKHFLWTPAHILSLNSDLARRKAICLCKSIEHLDRSFKCFLPFRTDVLCLDIESEVRPTHNKDGNKKHGKHLQRRFNRFWRQNLRLWVGSCFLSTNDTQARRSIYTLNVTVASDLLSGLI